LINPFLTKPNYIRIYGHRGARGDIVENSISGFKYTFDLGIKAVEFDVVISKDNIPTIFHDYRLNPDLVKDASGNWITDKSMKLVELTYEEISKYSIGSIKPETKYAKRFKNQKPITGEKIPKLTDFFKLVTEDKYKDVFLNLEIKKGEVTALVGASGAGKSTMLALILKFITPNNGDIFIDDKNLKILNTKDIRKNIALVQQQPFLFSGTIIDVIRMGRNFTKEEVIESARKANAHNFIQNLPEKYETELTERGSNFSGGQIQRIAIARAILGNPSILLLDEATSALDVESESEVQKGLN